MEPNLVEAGKTSLTDNFSVFSRMLISFTKQEGVPDWWGYTLAFLMFFTAFLQTLILHHHFQYCFVTGMNVRTAVIGAIYRKVQRVLHFTPGHVPRASRSY